MQRILSLIICLHFFCIGFCGNTVLHDSRGNKNFSEYNLTGPGDTISYVGVLCPNGSIVLTASNAPNNASIQWKLGSMNVGNSSPTYTATQAGTYTVTVGPNTYPPLTIN